MIEVYNYLHGMCFMPSDSLLRKAPPSAMRGHDHKLLKRHCHSQLRLQFFIFSVNSSWNCLPKEVKSAPSLNAFKVRFDKYWVRSITECVQSKIGQVLGQMPIFTSSRDVSTTKISEQPKVNPELKG